MWRLGHNPIVCSVYHRLFTSVANLFFLQKFSLYLDHNIWISFFSSSSWSISCTNVFLLASLLSHFHQSCRRLWFFLLNIEHSWKVIWQAQPITKKHIPLSMREDYITRVSRTWPFWRLSLTNSTTYFYYTFTLESNATLRGTRRGAATPEPTVFGACNWWEYIIFYVL